MVLGEGIIQRFLTNALSAYFDNIDKDNLSVAVVSGDISLSNMHVKRSVVQHLGLSSSLQLVNGSVGSLRAKVPWHRFGTAPIEFELNDLYILLEPSDTEEDAGARGEEAAQELLKKSVEELISSESGTGSGGGWRGWLRSAGNLAKRLIDHIEIIIKIRNVHIRYAADAFTAGATLEELAVTTTTQKGAMKSLYLTKLAFYCNPLEDAMEEIIMSVSESKSANDGKLYVLEPLSGGIELSFPPPSVVSTNPHLEEVVLVKGDFDSVKFRFTKEQLSTWIWAELKRVILSNTSLPLPSTNTTSSSPVVSEEIAADPSWASEKKLTLSLRLGEASCSIDTTTSSRSGTVEFVGEDLEVVGDVGSEMSQVKFRMKRLTLRDGAVDSPILSTNCAGENDFVVIDLKTNDKEDQDDMELVFKLGPVSFDFHPAIVSSILAFLKGSESPHHFDASAIKRSKEKTVRIKFLWESMDVKFYLVVGDGGPKKFASGRMSASSVDLELSQSSFLAQGELGDLSLDHVVEETRSVSILSLLTEKSSGYLFRFLVRSDSPNSPTVMDFELSAVRLVVVNSVILRLWGYIFDSFLPALTGDLHQAQDHDIKNKSQMSKSALSDNDHDSSRSSSSSSSYLLSLNVDVLEIVVPVSAMVEEADALKIELLRLAVKNGVDDAIDFDFQQVRISCLDQLLVRNDFRIQTTLFRDPQLFRVSTNIPSGVQIDLTWQQLCRLCQVLNCNILCGANDGVADVPSSQQVHEKDEKEKDAEWMVFEFRSGSLELRMDDRFESEISLDSWMMSISKFRSPKSIITIECDDLSLRPVGTVSLVSVQIESDLAGRSINASVTDPIFNLNIGLLFDLQLYFFSASYATYTPIAFHPVPDRPPERDDDFETVLNVNLVNSKLVMAAAAGQFYISSGVMSYQQTYQYTEKRSNQKFVLSNASVHYDCNSTSGSYDDESNLLVGNLDLFVSLSIDCENGLEIAKLNCEPLSIRLGFSHLKELGFAVEGQKNSISAIPTTTLVVSRSAVVKKQRETEMVFHSMNVVIVNDFASLQNTPLLHASIIDLEISSNSLVTADSNGIASNKNSSHSFSADISVDYFNKAAVSWEPLIEGQGAEGGSNQALVKLHASKTALEFTSLEGSRELSEQISFEVRNTAGVQLNITEALIRSVVENMKNWSSWKSAEINHRSGSEELQEQQAAVERVVFSPYSVKNLTGEASIWVSWNEGVAVEIKNLQEVALPNISVHADENESIFVKIETSSSWTLPRVPLDKPGDIIFNGGRSGGDLIGQISVTEDGRKRLVLQTSVLIMNEFGSALGMQLDETTTSEDDLINPIIEIAPNEFVAVPTSSVDTGRFRLLIVGSAGSTNAELSGPVSIADIKARTDSGKLWQIKAGERFMYLSGNRKVFSFQDKQVHQLVISVYAPVRVFSTLPCMVDLQIVASSGQARLLSAATSIGLNGKEYISAVPLTGKLDMTLSLLENRIKCVSVDSFQIWPLPVHLFEQDSSTKQMYLPVQFRAAHEETVPVRKRRPTCLELRLYFDSVALRPPLITIHSPHWLVCVDVPQQLRFVYMDDEEHFVESTEVVTPRGERSYVAPMHSRGRKISAWLNETRSEPVAIDTVGSTGQLTLDAFDEVSKIRVKQDLAVRVSSAPSGLVRDFPVKITTVSPKYVVVNASGIEGNSIYVKQLGEKSQRQRVMEVKPGDQIPFRWWTGEERMMQIQLKEDGPWSEGFKANEIGETCVRGIEVRLFHGGFYIVVSSLHTMALTASGAKTASLVMSNSVYRLVLPGLSVSVTGPAASQESERAEICLLDLKSVSLNVSLSSIANEIDLRIGSVQLDDLRSDPKFPVVFSKRKSSLSSAAGSGSNGAVEIFISWLLPSNPFVLNFESVLVRLADAELCIDYSLISDLTDMIVRCTRPVFPNHFPFRFVPALELLPVGSLRIWSFKEFVLNPMRVSLSFSPGSSNTAASVANYSVIHRAISSMSAVERSPLKFRPLVLTKFRASRSNVVSIVTEHYKFELYREMRTIMGSAEMFGNPIGLIGSVSTGVSDLFSEPLNAIREMQGPEDVINVADKTAKGAKSFFKNTTFGVFNSFSKLAATSAQTLSILTEDDEFLRERSEMNNKRKPVHIGDGVAVGVASFGRGLISGLSGLVTKPVEGMEQEGIAGLAKGTVKGVGGLFLKPVAGLLDFAKSTADGVVSSTRDSSLDSSQIRLPRMLYRHDRLIKVVNPEHSLLKWYLSRLESVPSYFTYCSHIFDSQNGLLIAASSEHLVAADTNARRLSLLVPLWRLVGVTADLDNLILSITVLVRGETTSPNTSKLDLELSSVLLVKSVQQLIANAMGL